MRSIVASHKKLTITSWEQSSKLIHLQLHMKLLKNSMLTILWSFSMAIEANWKVKKPNKWVASWADQTSKKLCLKCCLLVFYATATNHFFAWSDCDVWQVDFMWQPAMTSSIVGLRSSKALPKAKLAPKKVMVTVWWSTARLILYSFLNPSETITNEKYAWQIDEMHQKLQHLQQPLVNRKGPILLPNNSQPHTG